ncbi:uncharacterized protein LOC5520674 [Nematostella vectensis]|uniref:uncharacterized protein LOC5520674 n=1 Tax=Nematostella vectensis TaxID=45351 RepID=UPI0020775D1D|nr:uncharacterized protein LOC5520674 [Nematostella vectensis]
MWKSYSRRLQVSVAVAIILTSSIFLQLTSNIFLKTHNHPSYTTTLGDVLERQEDLILADFQDRGINKTEVLLVLIVSSAPRRKDRRDSIRQSYWKYCKTSQVICVFFTDGLVDNSTRDQLRNESRTYGDLRYQPLQGGKEFGYRFLLQIKWAMAHYEFQYLLRVDDDYFVCLNRLLNELPRRPKNNLVWGHFYCLKDLVYVDEAWMIFSVDVIRKFLSQDDKHLVCHPHADQQIAIWLNNIPGRIYFNDPRLHHARAGLIPEFKTKRDICNVYLGVHGAYSDLMAYFGEVSNDEAKGHVMNIADYRLGCPHWGFEWTEMAGFYRFEPKPCVNMSSWGLDHNMYAGDEELVTPKEAPSSSST